MNEISSKGKFFAGFLLISFFVINIMALVAFWPDRLPEPGEKAYHYAYKPFQMTLIDTAEWRLMTLNEHIPPKAISNTTSTSTNTIIKKDSIDTSKIAKVPPVKADNTTGKETETTVKSSGTTPDLPVSYPTIHLNTILLLLVTFSGFLGALVYIASSFTNFVGANKFERNWLLWYVVKPFIGSAIAIISYFAFRAGFFSGSENGGNVNIYGLISLSALAGLFTDKATLKLEEVFTVLFKPKDDRPGKIEDVLSIENVEPVSLQAQGVNHMKLNGKLLTKSKLTIKMGNALISNADITDTLIKFDYAVPADLITQPNIKLLVTDEKSKVICSKELPITP